MLQALNSLQACLESKIKLAQECANFFELVRIQERCILL